MSIYIFLASLTKSTSSSIAFTPLIVSYTVEILPYQLRAKGFNVFNFSISLSLIFNQYVNPIALGRSSVCMLSYRLRTVECRCNWMEVLCAFHVSFVWTCEVHLTQVVYCCWLICEAVFLWFCEFENFLRRSRSLIAGNSYHWDQKPHTRGNRRALRRRHGANRWHCCCTGRSNARYQWPRGWEVFRFFPPSRAA